MTVDAGMEQEKPQAAWSWGFFGCVVAIIACIVVMATPLQRRVGTPLMTSLPTNRLLLFLGSWMPANFHWLPNAQDAFVSTNNLEFLFLVGIAFALYGLAMLFLLRLPAAASYRHIERLMWAGVLVAGMIFIITPAMLSHDLFVYADYGHTFLTSHANLYFVPPASVSHSYDQITLLDDWRTSVAAYGPFWIIISTLLAIVGGNHPLRYLVGFRGLGLMAHLVNTWLIMRILRASGRSPRTVVVGGLLYALNPLALLESAFGAHNDVVMLTCILLGILLAQRGEKRGFQHLADYALPALAFTLAALIKFTSIPLIVFFLALVAFRASQTLSQADRQASRWIAARLSPPGLLRASVAGLVCAGTTLLFYGPFWIGHSLTAILTSFSSPPSSRLAENSILRASEGWIAQNGLPPSSSWMHALMLVLTNHAAWNILNLLVVACAMLVGIVLLWRSPTTATLILASLCTLGALLLVTPWFFAWYVTWLVALSAIIFTRPVTSPEQIPSEKTTSHVTRMSRALVAFALVFSASAFFSYLVNGNPLLGNSGYVQCLRIFGMPLLALVVVLLVGSKKYWRWWVAA